MSDTNRSPDPNEEGENGGGNTSPLQEDGEDALESVDESEAASPPAKGPDEAYCISCGELIKEEAEICPHCGVRQQASATVEKTANGTTAGSAEITMNTTTGTGERTIPEYRLYELQKVARKNITTVMVVSLLLTPAGYWMVGKKWLAVINLLTLNYFLLGFVIVPFHTRSIIKNSRKRLERSGHGW